MQPRLSFSIGDGGSSPSRRRGSVSTNTGMAGRKSSRATLRAQYCEEEEDNLAQACENLYFHMQEVPLSAIKLCYNQLDPLLNLIRRQRMIDTPMSRYRTEVSIFFNFRLIARAEHEIIILTC